MKPKAPWFFARSCRALGLLLTAALATLLSAGPAPGAERTRPRAPVVDACVAHYTEAQELRLSGRLLESRTELRSCAAQACPALVQRDCIAWLDAIETELPSITVRMTLDGRAHADVRVSVDGKPRRELALGKALQLNPGKHRVRGELPGLPPFEEEFISSEGERYRLLEVALSSPGFTRARGTDAIEQRRPVPLLSYVFGGVAIAAAVNGGIWGTSSLSLRHELADRCAPACPRARVDELRRRALITDVSWGVSALSLIGASAFFVLRPTLPVEVDVTWLPGGGMGRVRFIRF